MIITPRIKIIEHINGQLRITVGPFMKKNDTVFSYSALHSSAQEEDGTNIMLT